MAIKTLPPKTNILPITATTAIVENRFVATTGTYPAALGGLVLGASLTDIASGESVAIQTAGVVLVECGSSVSAGEIVQSTTAGKAQTLTTPSADVATLFKAVGQAIDGGGNGDLIRVLLR